MWISKPGTLTESGWSLKSPEERGGTQAEGKLQIAAYPRVELNLKLRLFSLNAILRMA